eukprot:GHVP01009477.1.p1 GENE.GHVP01009477.1~~GHVP01009477.1.p1  ORF type:complete len:189 (+),score=33.07 GHVP01009477.1:88-654(+)
MEIKHLADQFGSALEDFGTPQGNVCCLHDELIPENDANPLEPEFRSIYVAEVEEAKNGEKMFDITIRIENPERERKILQILQNEDERFVVVRQEGEDNFSMGDVAFLAKREDYAFWSITMCHCRPTFQSVRDYCPTGCAKYRVSVKNPGAEAENHLEGIFSQIANPRSYVDMSVESESENYYSFCTIL